MWHEASGVWTAAEGPASDWSLEEVRRRGPSFADTEDEQPLRSDDLAERLRGDPFVDRYLISHFIFTAVPFLV